MLLINSDSVQQPKLEKGEPHMQITNCNNERSVPTQLTEIMFSCESIKLRATNYTTAACYIQEFFLKFLRLQYLNNAKSGDNQNSELVIPSSLSMM